MKDFIFTDINGNNMEELFVNVLKDYKNKNKNLDEKVKASSI